MDLALFGRFIRVLRDSNNKLESFFLWGLFPGGSLIGKFPGGCTWQVTGISCLPRNLTRNTVLRMTKSPAPLISIVLPVYNSGKTLDACLACLQAQTYPNIEIVAVYLDSQDDTLAKLQAFTARPLVIVRQEQKNGPGGARNLGVAAARGEYIGFAEADDTFPADFYEQLFLCADRTQSDIAVGVTLSQGKPMGRPEAGVVKGFCPSFSRLPHGGCFDKLFKTELIKPLRFAENCRWEDNPFILQAFWRARQVSFTPLARYTYMPFLWSANYYRKLQEDLFTVARQMMDFICQQPQATSRDKAWVKRKICDWMGNPFLIEPGVYPRLSALLGYPLFLKVRYYRLRFKQFRHKFYRRKKHD